MLTIVESYPSPECEKSINGKTVTVTPLLCILANGSSTFLTFGYILAGSTQAEVRPMVDAISQLVRTMRSVLMLAEVPTIHDQTINACWEVSSIAAKPDNKILRNKLAKEFGGHGVLKEIMAMIRADRPSEESFDQVLRVMAQHHIAIDLEELRTELDAGRIPETPTLLELLRQ